MTWTAADIPDQSGRVAVVTGANGGLGLEVARQLAGHGALVVMAARDQAKAASARDSIRGQVPNAALELQPLDLASLASVRQAAAAVLAGHRRVDILVNNAGLMAIGERRTEDGFEMQLGVNHLGHFALTAWLLPALLAIDGKPASEILGPVDAIKLRSSMTLFATADPRQTVFRQVLDRYFQGAEDPETVRRLGAGGGG